MRRRGRKGLAGTHLNAISDLRLVPVFLRNLVSIFLRVTSFVYILPALFGGVPFPLRNLAKKRWSFCPAELDFSVFIG